MIRLVCCDIDGTLIPYGKNELNLEIFGLIRELKERGIAFALSSGRQLTSLQQLFAPVKELCHYVTENGGYVYDGEGRPMGMTPMDRELAMAIGKDFFENSGGQGETMFSGNNMAYLWSRGLGMERRILQIGNRHKLVTDPEREITEPIVKVSGYFYEGVGAYAEYYTSRWKKANCVVAGPFWIDSMQADKGVGVRTLCEALGISPKEVLAFGDNDNDVPMLDLVGLPYIMESSKEELKLRYPRHAESPEAVLREMLDTGILCGGQS